MHDPYSSGTVTAAKTVFASSEQEFTHRESQPFFSLGLLISATPLIIFELTTVLELSLAWHTGGATLFPLSRGTAEAVPPLSTRLLPEDPGRNSLQGNHLLACKNGSSDEGLNPSVTEDEIPIAPTPAADPEPDTMAESNPAASVDRSPFADGSPAIEAKDRDAERSVENKMEEEDNEEEEDLDNAFARCSPASAKNPEAGFFDQSRALDRSSSRRSEGLWLSDRRPAKKAKGRPASWKKRQVPPHRVPAEAARLWAK